MSDVMRIPTGSIAPLVLCVCLWAFLTTGRSAASQSTKSSAETTVVEANVVYAAGDGYYLGHGTDIGLRAGLEGEIRRASGPVAFVRVRSASRTSAFVAVVRLVGSDPPRVGDRVVFRVPVPRETTEPPSTTADRPFEPLLAPSPDAAPVVTRNVFHGDVRAGLAWTRDRERDANYVYQRLASSGAGERIGGAPWSVEWDVVLDTRMGSGYRDHDDYRDVRIRLDQLVVRRHFADGSTAGVGRIQPLALPGIGLFDGAYGEWQSSERLRFGGVVGFRPDPEHRGPTSAEPGVAGWAALDVGDDDGVRVGGGLGALATWYDGKADRHAIFADVRVVSPSGWRVDVTSEVDVYQSADVESGVSLTRLGARLDVPVSDAIGVWADLQTFRLPDTRASRSTFEIDETLYGLEEVFDRGYRRTSLGARAAIGAGWHVDTEATVVTARGIEHDLQLRVGVRKNAPFGWKGTSFDVSGFNLVGVDLDGFGFRTGFGGMISDTLFARVGYILTRAERDAPGAPTTSNHRPSIDLDWRITRAWSIYLRTGVGLGDGTKSTTAEAGVAWRF